MALYFVTVWPPAGECTFFKYPSSWPERIKTFKIAAIIRFDLDVLKMTVQGGCCTSVVCKSINKKTEKGLRLDAIMSMLNEPNPFLCHPAVLGSRNCATRFLSQLFYSQFDIVKT